MHSSPKRAHTVAVATPCWPAPVSAMIRLLAEPLRDQRLPERVVQLVRAGVHQILALEVDPLVRREALDARERGGAACIVRAQSVQLRVERVVVSQ